MTGLCPIGSKRLQSIADMGMDGTFRDLLPSWAYPGRNQGVSDWLEVDWRPIISAVIWETVPSGRSGRLSACGYRMA